MNTSYHVAFTQDAPNDQFKGYVNGELIGTEFIAGQIGNHPNRNGIGAINQNIYFHDDGPVGNAPARPDGSFAFKGAISDVAVYNSIIDSDGMQARYEATSLPLSESFRVETQEFLNQIKFVSDDSNIRGVNLLQKEDLIVDFNSDSNKKHKLEVEGTNFTLEGLGLEDINFQRPSQVEDAIRNIRNAISEVRDYGTKLATDFSIISIRQDFTENIINTFQAGSDDLVNADLNEEGANLLAAQTRLDLSTTALSLASQSRATILEIFTGSSGFLA